MTHLSIFQVCQILDIKHCVRKTDKHAGLSDFRKKYFLIYKNIFYFILYFIEYPLFCIFLSKVRFSNIMVNIEKLTNLHVCQIFEYNG